MKDERVELAAHLADTEAVRALGISDPAADGFDAWAWNFSKFGQTTMARAALVAATLAAPVWSRYRASDDFDAEMIGGGGLAEAIAGATQHLHLGASSSVELLPILERYQAQLDEVRFYVYEASGDAERVAARERALSALTATVAMLETLTWTPDPTEALDAAEQEARVAAGPALNVVQAFAHCCHATGLDASQLRAALRDALL